MKKILESNFRIPKGLKEKINIDLSRKHKHAYERVGFILTKTHWIDKKAIVLAYDYKPVAEEDYIVDENVGARINSKAIKKAMELAYSENCGVFHVHTHFHKGKPIESSSDLAGIRPMMESVARINKNQLFGYVILSQDSALCKVKPLNDKPFIEVNSYSEVGYPMNFVCSGNRIDNFNIERQKRQGFLGEKAPFLMKNIKIAIIGYGGGGSHIGQQLSHIGFENVVVFDHDDLEESNINRLIGALGSDVENQTPKVDIAKRTMRGILPSSKVELVKKKWQDAPEILQQCDIVIGGVDSFIERQELEAECRRYLIPHIDMGMDIYEIESSYSISGQIILSMPGACCMKCLSFITEKKLALEAAKYGNIGGNPQVVWSNGVLASTAIGVLVDLAFGWSDMENRDVYLSYDGNLGLVKEHPRLKYKPQNCEHYPIRQIGPVQFQDV
jgi:molybdopterin/thiamine biosynthesis adenylyltransferase